MITMKRHFTLTFFIICAIATGVAAQEAEELTIPLSDPAKKGKMKVEIRRGSIEIKGTDRKDVLLVYRVIPGKHRDEEEEKDGLKRIGGSSLGLEVSERNNYVVVETESQHRLIEFTIEVPRNFDLHAETYNQGHINISNVQGEIVAENYNGKITTLGISGSLVAGTYNGDIKAVFDAVTPDTPMAFTTYNGNVDITFPKGTKASLKMRSDNGEIYSAFDFVVERDHVIKNMKNQSVKNTKGSSNSKKIYLDEWVRGTINGGGAEMMMKNYNGNIYIREN